MKQREWVTLSIIVGLAGVLLYVLRGKLPMGYGMQQQPDKVAGNILDAWTYDDIFPKAIGEHFVTPDKIQNPVYLPVRYPPRAGHEISTLIDHGYVALYQPRKDLYSWVDCPPTESG